MSSADVTSRDAAPPSLEDARPEDTVMARPAAERRRRRRPGRFRRWILRPLIWTLTLLAVFVFVLQLLLDTSYMREWMSSLAADKLATLLDCEVAIADLSLTLLPLSVEVWGLSVEGRSDVDADLPFLEVPWLAVDADLNALQRNVIRLQQVRVERPRFYLQYFSEGKNNVLRLHRPGEKRRHEGGALRHFEVRIEHIEVERAEVMLDQEIVKWSMSGDAVRARFQGLGHLHVSGQASAQNVVVRLPNARPITVAVSGKGSVRRGRVEIESASASGPGILVTGDGVCQWPLDDPLNKKCEIRVRGETSGEKLAEIGYFPHLSGAIEVDGTYTWRPRTTGWRSRLRAPRIAIWNRELEDVEGVLVADRYQVRFGLHQARYGGGAIDGSIDVATRQEDRPMVVDLDFRDVAADRLLADQNVPAGAIASRVSGNVTYRYPLREGRRGNGHGEVTVVADPGREGLPLVGSFPLRIERGVVRSDSVSLRSATQSVLASGFYDVDRRRGRFDYEVESADLGPLVEVLRLAPEAGEPWPQWLPTAGEGRLEGTLEMLPGETSTEVAMRLVKIRGPDLETPHELAGSFRVDRRGLDRLRLELSDATAALMLHGRLPFDLAAPPADGEEEGGLRLTFDAFEWPLAAVHPWLRFDLPLDGRISGRLDLHADAAGSDGRLRAEVSPAVLSGVPFDALAGRLEWDPERLAVSELALRAAAGEADGYGMLTWAGPDAPERLDVVLRGSRLAIGKPPLAAYLPRRDLAGEVAVTAHLTGSRQRPRLELGIAVAEIAVGSRVLKGRPCDLDVKWAGGRLEVSGRLLDMATLRGGGNLDRQRGEIELELDGHDVAGLLELLLEEPPADVGGSFTGRLRIAGETGGDQRVALELDAVEVDYRGRRLANLEPVTLLLAPDYVEIGSLYLEERATGSELFLTGRVGWEPTAPVDLRLQATLAASWLELYRPDLDVGGYFDLLAKVGGTVEKPYLDGQGEVRRGRVLLVEIPDFPYAFEELSGILLFYPEEVVVDRLEAALAGGRLRLEGRTAVPRRGEPLRYRLRLAGRDLRLRYPQGWLLDGDANFTLRTEEAGPDAEGPRLLTYLLSGRADLRGLEYTEDIPLGFAQVIQDALLRQRLEVEEADQLLSAIQLNVEVAGPRALRVRNNLAELTGDVDLAVRGTLAQPVFYGAIDLDPGGRLAYNSVDYDLDRGRLSFANPYRLDPEVDLVATTRVRDFDVILTLSGTAERLNAGFSSEPPLPALEVFELLATGGSEELEANTVRRADEIGQEQSMSAASFLYGQAASVIGERVSNLFGFDKFRIAPLTGSGDNLSQARVTVGKRLSKDVFVSYSTDPASTEEQRLQIEWQVSRGLVLVLTQNGDSTYEADARWETSF